MLGREALETVTGRHTRRAKGNERRVDPPELPLRPGHVIPLPVSATTLTHTTDSRPTDSTIRHRQQTHGHLWAPKRPQATAVHNPLLRGGGALAGLDSTDIEPRSAIGLADGGRTLTLLSTDGREGASTGLTLTELARVVSDLGCSDGVYLDGGASATLVARDPATGDLTVRNHLDHGQERRIPNALGIFAG
ncbi:phosphodiester glycosidase family protein [Kitasatospora sp. NPDC058190]|uniref:phosphodiester glycosidase family protein n=1 Tax=Kitasatospora sp. NPDC058190 TaxID=3346371 RepID=UPI0036DA8612